LIGTFLSGFPILGYFRFPHPPRGSLGLLFRLSFLYPKDVSKYARSRLTFSFPARDELSLPPFVFQAFSQAGQRPPTLSLHILNSFSACCCDYPLLFSAAFFLSPETTSASPLFSFQLFLRNCRFRRRVLCWRVMICDFSFLFLHPL